MGDSDSGILVGTVFKFYPFGAGTGIGVNFYTHIGIRVGIRITGQNLNRSQNRALWNQSVTPESLLILTSICN